MRRTTAAAEDHAETPTALIDRLSAEYAGDLFADLGDGYGDDPVPVGAATGRHRRGVAPTFSEGSATAVAATTVTSRHGAGSTGATVVVPRRGAATGATAAVSRHAAPVNRSTVRRLAPLGVGAAVMLVATLVITLIPQAEPTAGPELNSQLAAAPIAPASPTAGGYLDADATPVPASTTTTTPGRPLVGTNGLPPAAAKPKPATKPAPKPAAAAPRAGTNGNGSEAADKMGWQQVGGDEFNGSGLSGSWGVYEGAGHDGNGRRVRSAISVGGGMLTISGNANGDSGGMSWNDDQTYGKWEVRARFPRGDDNYHPVLLLWPQDGWPPEVDFSETTSASDGTNFYLHYNQTNQQVSASKQMDITQWHNYAVEWVAGRVTGYIDGVKWFESTDGNTVPNQPMHLAIQLDNFKGGGMQPTEMDVDYVRIYK